MKNQKSKNLLLLSLIFVSGLIVFFAISSLLIIVAVPFQSTAVGNGFFENMAKFAFSNPGLSVPICLLSVLVLVALKKPFERFLKRNGVEDRVYEFFNED
ncbi:MAG: hypothetical protein ACLFNO_00065 [Parcubacteria group bacterium]